MELPTDVEASRHPHGAAAAINVGVLAAHEEQHGARLHEGVGEQNDAGIVPRAAAGATTARFPWKWTVSRNQRLCSRKSVTPPGDFFVVKTGKRVKS